MIAKIIIGLVLICGLIMAGLNAQEQETDNVECPHICPDTYDPVCATDGKHFFEFANECEFKSNKCLTQKESIKNSTITFLDMCRTEHIGNLDKLLTKLGDLDLRKAGCLKPCLMAYKPMCISNGKYRFQTANRCIMDTINCGLGDKDPFKILKYGNC